MTTAYLKENGEWLDEKDKSEYRSSHGRVREVYFDLRSEYGRGKVLKYADTCVMLTISNFMPKVNINYERELGRAFLQMSFLVEGEKVIAPKKKPDLVLEGGYGMLFFKDSYQGKSTIYRDRLYREVSIRVTKAFLEENNLMDLVKIYGLSKDFQILPLTEDIMSVLESLEVQNPTGELKSIYYRAKILELLILQLNSLNDGQMPRIRSLRDNKLSALYNLRKHVKNNLHKNFTLLDLSMHFGMQQQSLNERFIAVFGVSVHEFIVAEKMCASKKLLKDTEMLVYEIAEQVGYRNGTHFTAAFKRYYGKTPREYRKSIQ
ncbi:MAG: AraC family transcriptional regulator [Bacteroidota bacterium]